MVSLRFLAYWCVLIVTAFSQSLIAGDSSTQIATVSSKDISFQVEQVQQGSKWIIKNYIVVQGNGIFLNYRGSQYDFETNQMVYVNQLLAYAESIGEKITVDLQVLRKTDFYGGGQLIRAFSLENGPRLQGRSEPLLNGILEIDPKELQLKPITNRAATQVWRRAIQLWFHGRLIGAFSPYTEKDEDIYFEMQKVQVFLQSAIEKHRKVGINLGAFQRLENVKGNYLVSVFTNLL